MLFFAHAHTERGRRSHNNLEPALFVACSSVFERNSRCCIAQPKPMVLYSPRRHDRETLMLGLSQKEIMSKEQEARSAQLWIKHFKVKQVYNVALREKGKKRICSATLTQLNRTDLSFWLRQLRMKMPIERYV
ncbi:uncharacterized protein LOC116851200 [Odontomachus brunneus]|uniref:uncharacterized protein LOC116851200 n=1 Tax=Odontomachus brunneus TaxID=486640 RepID=UPI0013F24CEB|nr:uncharacterized protein LOC116851200 [Odontomachus brunneus]